MLCFNLLRLCVVIAVAGGPLPIARGLIDTVPAIPGNKGWLILGLFAAMTVSLFSILGIIRRFDIGTPLPAFFLVLLAVVGHFLMFLLAYFYNKGIDGRNLPVLEMGRPAKCATTVLSVCAAIVIRLYLGYDLTFTIALIGFTIYLHALIRFQCCIFSDVNIRDVLLAGFVQVVVSLAIGNTYAFVAALLFCGAAALYQYCYWAVADIYIEQQLEAGAQYLCGR